MTNLSTTPQYTSGNIPTTCTIHVIKGYKDVYMNSSAWSEYNIVEDAVDNKGKCKAPTIEYVNGNIICSSETEGAVCHYTVKIVFDGTDGCITNDSGKIEITAYATANEYENSEEVTETFDYAPASGGSADVNGDGSVDIDDVTSVINVICGGK